MQTADRAASLMDDAEFFEALGKLEVVSEEDMSGFPELTGSFDRGRQKPAAIARSSRPAAEARGQAPRFILPGDAKADPIVEEPQSFNVASSRTAPRSIEAAKPSGLHLAAAVVGFVLMMLVGAGAAVLVFHDRVEQIVVQWQAAGR
jgi:hypothetical protein